MRLRNLIQCGVLALVFGCEAEEQVDTPTPPDTAPLLAAFAQPTAELTAETGPELVRGVIDSLESVQRLARLFGYVQALVPAFTQAQQKGQALTASGQFAERRQAITAGIGGYGVLDHRCDQDTGDLQVTAVFDEDGLRPEIWGTLAGCLIADAESPPDRFDGAILLNLDLDSGLNTVAFEGDVAREDEIEAMRFIIQIDSNGTVGMSRDVEGGNLIALLTSAGGDLKLGVRSVSGEWTCGVLAATGAVTCEGSGGTVSW